MIEKDITYYSESRREMLKYIPSSAMKILDIGCGRGSFCVQYSTSTKEIWGIEPDPESAEIASGIMYKVFNEKVETAIDSLPENYFDLIIFNDVLEHCIDPWSILERIKSKLLANGIVVSSIPNVRYIKNISHLLFGKDWRYEKGGVLDSTHLRFFTKKSMLSLFNNSGYKVEVIDGINRTKSIRFLILVFLFNLLFLFRHFDTIYKQFAIVSKKKQFP